MSKRLWTVVVALAVMSTQTACFTTRITTSRSAAGPAYTDRQWFTLGGLASLSSPAGRECQNGVSTAESRLSGTDWLINVGLSVAGGFAGGLACAKNTNDSLIPQTTCAVLGAALMPFMLASRTVEYSCAQGPSSNARPDWMPPAQGSAQSPVSTAQAETAPTSTATTN